MLKVGGGRGRRSSWGSVFPSCVISVKSYNIVHIIPFERLSLNCDKNLKGSGSMMIMSSLCNISYIQ